VILVEVVKEHCYS